MENLKEEQSLLENSVLFGKQLSAEQQEQLKSGEPILLQDFEYNGKKQSAFITLSEDGKSVNVEPLPELKTINDFNLSSQQLEEITQSGKTVYREGGINFVLEDTKNGFIEQTSFDDLGVPKSIQGIQLTTEQQENLALGQTVTNFQYKGELFNHTSDISINDGGINFSNSKKEINDKGKFEAKLLHAHLNLDFEKIKELTSTADNYQPSNNIKSAILNDGNLSNEHKQQSLSALGVDNAAIIIRDNEQNIRLAKEKEQAKKMAAQQKKQQLKQGANKLTQLKDKAIGAMRFG